MKKCTIDTLSIDFIGVYASTLFFIIIYKKKYTYIKNKVYICSRSGSQL